MKNIAKILMVALLVIVATFAVSAAKVEIGLSDAGAKEDYTSGVYYLDVVASDSLYTNVLDLKFTINTDKIELFCMDTEYGYFPLNEEIDPEWYAYAETALVLGTNGKSGLQKATYEKSYVNATVNGNLCTVQFTTNAPAGKISKFPKENFKAFQVGLYIPDVSALTSDDFKIEHVFMDTWDGVEDGEGAKYGFGSWAEPVAGQIEVNNEVIHDPVPTVVTIAVVAGDIVYLQDGSVAVITEDNAAYEIPATNGIVYVNKGYESQKFYTVVDGVVTEDEEKADGVVSTSETSIRNDATASGIRFTSKFLTAMKDVVVEYGYITTVESAKSGLAGTDYVLDMALVATGKAKKAEAYVAGTDKDIFWNVEDDKTIVTAVVTGIPMTKDAVTTNVVTRPYYELENDVVVYGEPVTKTIYEVAVAVKDQDAETYAKYQEYIDEIIALVAGDDKDVVIDFSPLFD